MIQYFYFQFLSILGAYVLHAYANYTQAGYFRTPLWAAGRFWYTPDKHLKIESHHVPPKSTELLTCRFRLPKRLSTFAVVLPSCRSRPSQCRHLGANNGSFVCRFMTGFPTRESETSPIMHSTNGPERYGALKLWNTVKYVFFFLHGGKREEWESLKSGWWAKIKFVLTGRIDTGRETQQRTVCVNRASGHEVSDGGKLNCRT